MCMSFCSPQAALHHASAVVLSNTHNACWSRLTAATEREPPYLHAAGHGLSRRCMFIKAQDSIAACTARVAAANTGRCSVWLVIADTARRCLTCCHRRRCWR